MANRATVESLEGLCNIVEIQASPRLGAVVARPSLTAPGNPMPIGPCQFIACQRNLDGGENRRRARLTYRVRAVPIRR